MEEERVIGAGCSTKEGKYIITLYKDADDGKLVFKVKEKDSKAEEEEENEPRSSP
ncbi:hypothetical protein J7L60_02220 [Candidatus Bathyarchaeota archaeon]|nr:hypothetical protein [Candidatus Bathyarchaeota archaeon]